MQNFLGQDGFIWFVGVVEDRNDPQKLGRVRVRCLGYHTADRIALPTSDLPLGQSRITYYFIWHIRHRADATRPCRRVLGLRFLQGQYIRTGAYDTRLIARATIRGGQRRGLL